MMHGQKNIKLCMLFMVHILFIPTLNVFYFYIRIVLLLLLLLLLWLLLLLLLLLLPVAKEEEPLIDYEYGAEACHI